MNTKVCLMMVGLPGSGKSTIANAQAAQLGIKVYSTDQILEEIATRRGVTYNDVFSSCIREATRMMDADIDTAIALGRSFIWDQTNLTLRSRATKIKRLVSAGYEVHVYYTYCDPEVRERRLASRVGKTIPPEADHNMVQSFASPSLSEGIASITAFATDEDFS